MKKILIICDKSVDLIESSKVDTSKYNVVVGYAAQFSCLLDNDMQDVNTSINDLDKTNKKGWFHMQECGDWNIPSEVKL